MISNFKRLLDLQFFLVLIFTLFWTQISNICWNFSFFCAHFHPLLPTNAKMDQWVLMLPWKMMVSVEQASWCNYLCFKFQLLFFVYPCTPFHDNFLIVLVLDANSVCLKGETGKMSASDPNSAIYVTDSCKEIKNKVRFLYQFLLLTGYYRIHSVPSSWFIWI